MVANFAVYCRFWREIYTIRGLLAGTRYFYWLALFGLSSPDGHVRGLYPFIERYGICGSITYRRYDNFILVSKRWKNQMPSENHFRKKSGITSGMVVNYCARAQSITAGTGMIWICSFPIPIAQVLTIKRGRFLNGWTLTLSIPFPAFFQ